MSHIQIWAFKYLGSIVDVNWLDWVLAEHLRIEVGAEIKAVNGQRVSNQGEYDSAIARACQMVRPGSIEMTVTIPQDE